jgi:hypothetical protein
MREVLRAVIDNVRSGSYESTGQVLDEAEKLLAEEEAMANEVLSGCAVRAAAQLQRIETERHYLAAIKIRLEVLYKKTRSPTVREQLSDEVDWIDEQLGIRQPSP